MSSRADQVYMRVRFLEAGRWLMIFLFTCLQVHYSNISRQKRGQPTTTSLSLRSLLSFALIKRFSPPHPPLRPTPSFLPSITRFSLIQYIYLLSIVIVHILCANTKQPQHLHDSTSRHHDQNKPCQVWVHSRFGHLAICVCRHRLGRSA